MATRNRFTALREQLAQQDEDEERTTSNRFTALREQLGVPRSRIQSEQQLTPQQIRDQGFFESFGRGLSSGVTQTKRSYGRVGQLGGIEGAQEYAEANEPAPIRTGFDFYNELANLNLGEAADIGGEIIASQLPNYASIGAGAIAGGLLGGPVGAFAGGLVGGLPLNLGEAVEGQQELIDQDTLSELNVGEALGTGLGSAALDVAPVLLPFTRVAGAIPAALTKTLPRKLGTGAVLGGLGEGVTEAAQEINLLGQRARLDEEFEFLRDIFEPEQVNQILNAFATGTIPGAAFGAATSPALGQAARAADDEVVGADGEAAAQHVEQPETLDNTPPTYGSSQFTFSDKQPIAKPAKEFAALIRKQYAGQLAEQDATVGQPHLTLLYGLDLDTAGAKALTEEMQDTGPVRIRTGRLGMFRNDDADVLYVTVEDVDGKLKALREELESTVGAPGQTRTDYQPHITLNYFQPGQGPTNLVDGTVEGVSDVEIELNALTFRTTDGGMVALPLASDKKKATDTITGVEESARKFKEAGRVEEVDEDVFPGDTPTPTPTPTPPAAPAAPKPKPLNQAQRLTPDVQNWVATQDLVTEESLNAAFGSKVKGNAVQRTYTLKKLYNDIVPSEKKPQFAPPPLIQESPDAKQQRVASGYTEIMRVDPQTLANIFAEDNDAQTLEHTPSRTERLRGVGSFDAYPRVSIVDGSLGIADGRHRIAVAAERGAPIDIAVTPADRQFIEVRLRGDKDNARPIPKDQIVDEKTTPGVVGQETEGDGQPDLQQGEETHRQTVTSEVIASYTNSDRIEAASVDDIALTEGLELEDAQRVHSVLRSTGVIDETDMTIPVQDRKKSAPKKEKPERKTGSPKERKDAAQAIAAARAKPEPAMDLVGQAPVAPTTAAFKRWFGNSVITNADNTPKRVYHASVANIKEFAFERKLFDTINFEQDAKTATLYYVSGVPSQINEKVRQSDTVMVGMLLQRKQGDWVFFEQSGASTVLEAKTESAAKNQVESVVNKPQPMSDRFGSGRRMFFFAENPDYAARNFAKSFYEEDTRYAENQGVTYPVYLKIEKPLLPEDPKAWRDMRPFFVEQIKQVAEQEDRAAQLARAKELFQAGRWEIKETFPGFTEYALQKGYDGFLSYEGFASATQGSKLEGIDQEKQKVWGVFKPEQIRFALAEPRAESTPSQPPPSAPGYAAGLNAQIKEHHILGRFTFDEGKIAPSKLTTHWAEFFGFDPNLEALKYVEDNFDLFSNKFSSDPVKAKLNFTSIKSKAKDMAKRQQQAQREAELMNIAAEQGDAELSAGIDPDIDFSEGFNFSIARNPITAQAQINLNKVLKRMPAFKVPVILKDTYADLPPHVMMNELETSFIDGVYDRTTGNIYIVRENIADEAHLERVLLHEIFGHYGVELTLAAYDRKVGRESGTTFREIASEIKTNLRSTSPINTSLSWRSPDYATYDAVVFDYAEVMERLGIEDQSIRDSYIAAEVIARTAERGTNPTWFERLMRFVREAFEYMGFVEASNFDALTVRGILANVNNELRMRRGDDKGAAPRLPPSLLGNKNYMDSVGYAANDAISNALFNMPAFSQQNAKAVTQATAPKTVPTTIAQPSEIASIVDDMRGAEDKNKAQRFLAAMKSPWARLPEGNDFNNVTSAHAWMRYVWGKSVGSMNFYAQKSGAFKKLLNFLNRQNGYAMRLTTKFDKMMRPWNEFSAPWRVGEQSNNTRVAGDLIMARLALGHNMTKAEIDGDAGNLVSINFDDPAEYKPISLQDGTTMNLALPRLEVNKQVFDELVKKAKKGGIDYWKNKPDIPMPGFNKREQTDAKRKIDQITAQVNPNVMKRFDALYDSQAELEIETLRSYIIQYTQMAQRDIMKAIARSTNYKQDAEGRTLLQSTMSRIQQRLDTMFRDSYDSGMFKMDGDTKTQYNQVVEDLAEAMKTGYLSPQLINTFDQETVTNLAKVAGKGVSDTLMTGLMDTLRTGMEYNARIAEAKRRAVENIASGHVSIRRFGRFITNITLTDPITKKTYSIRDLRSGYREMLPVLRYEGRSEAIESSKWFNDVFKDTPFYVKLEGSDKDDPPIAVMAEMDIRTTKEDTGSGVTNPMDTLHHLDSMGVNITQDQRDRIVKGMATYDARVRRQFLMQRKTTGWSRNYRRTFAANLTEGAHAAAARIYRFDVDDIIDNQANWRGDPTRLMEIQAGKENAKTPVQKLHWQREEIRYNRLYGNKSLIGEMQTAAQQLVDFSREHSNVGDTQAWSVMRTAVAAAQLGGSLMSAAIQATQTVYATVPYLSTFHQGTGFGGGFGITATMREVRKAAGETFRTVGTQWRDENELAGRIRKILGNDDKHPELAEWLIKEYDEGRVSAAHYNALVGNAMGRARSPSIGRGVQEWMRFFTKVEISNRMVAAISSYRLYYDAAIDAGMDKDRAHQHAAERTEETIDNTQGNYTLINRQPWARQGFPSVLMMYQMYPAIMIELLTHLPRKGQAMMLGSVFLAAGFEDLPFAENGMDLMTAIGRWMGWSQGEVKSLLKEYMEMADEITGFEGISTIGMHGLLDSVSGLNIGQRVGFGNMIPGVEALANEQGVSAFIDEFLGPAGGFIEQSVTFGNELKEGVKFDNLMSHKVWRNAPLSGVRGIIEGYDQLATGEARDSAARKVTDVTTWQAVMRMAGATSQDAVEAYEQVGLFRTRSSFRNKMRAQFMDNLVDARINNKPGVEQAVWKELFEWNKTAFKYGMGIELKPADISKAVLAARRSLGQRYFEAAPTQIKPLAINLAY